MQKAGRGYVIRFYDEKKGIALFLSKRGLSVTSPQFTNRLQDANVFMNNIDARGYVVKITPSVKKLYHRGYLYISKVFYKHIKSNWSGSEIPVAIKLTKPDRHDFLQSL